MRTPIRLTGVSLALLLATAVPAGELRIHVSPRGDDRDDGSERRPLATLTAAQEQVRDRVASGHPGPIDVVIGNGSWRLGETLTFDHRDSSPRTPVSYRAESPGTAILSGGAVLKGWRRAGDFWETDLPVWAEFAVRRLVVDGRSAPPAAEPDGGWYRVVRAGPDRRTSFHFDAAGFVLPQRPSGVELVFLHDWSTTRVGVEQLDPAGHRLVFRHPIGGDHEFFAIDGFEPHARFRLENDRGFADRPDEWLHDVTAGRLAIRAEPGAESPPEVVLPRVATLLRVQGTATRPVRGLTFKGITFAETACTLPVAGAAEVQAGFFLLRGAPAAAVNAGRAESNGIFMDEGSSKILVTGNEIHATARAPIRFHQAVDLTVRGNRLRVAPGVQPFTYVATDPARIVTEPNDVAADAPR